MPDEAKTRKAFDIDKYIKRNDMEMSARSFEVQSTYAKQKEEGGDQKYRQILEGNWRMERLLAKLPDDEFSAILTSVGALFTKYNPEEAKKFADGLASSGFETGAELRAAIFAAGNHGADTGLKYLSYLRETHLSEALIKSSGKGQKGSFYLETPIELFAKNEKAGIAVLKAEKTLAGIWKDWNPVMREEVFLHVFNAYSKSIKEGDEELAKFEKSSPEDVFNELEKVRKEAEKKA
jgi:hypothetical protein